MSKSFSDHSDIFSDETVLYEDWTPEELPEREEELDRLHDALAPATRGGAPHNTFVYGKTGQGKTVGVTYKLDDLQAYAEETGDLDLTVIDYSCAKDNTSYQVASNLVGELTGAKPRGYDLKTVFDMLYEELQEIGGTVVIVLDEIDSIGSDADILYELPRARANGHIEDMWVSVIGISNDFDFRGDLSPKVKDTLCEEEIHFAPYDADQLQSILERRAEKAFQADVLHPDVPQLAAAFAAKDKGSARQAIRYLYKAGELAANNGYDEVVPEHVREAEEIIERRNIEKGIRDLTVQDHLCLVAVTALEARDEAPARTREVYGEYKRVTEIADSDSIALRRVRDHLQELDLAGVVDGQTRHSGVKGGQHYVWGLDADYDTVVDVLRSVDRISDALARRT